MRIILLTLIMLVLSPLSINAHPGRTDSSGGHTCRTNCDSWGLNYGQYHSHNNTAPSGSSGVRSYQNSQDNSTIPSWLIWLVIIIIVLYFMIINSRSSNRHSRPHRSIIDVTPIPPKIYPSDEEVELCGIIIRVRYRNLPFFVATFIADNGKQYTVVGDYHERLYVNRRYQLQGTNTYDRRYGQQIKVKKLERL